jgi:hypothetical protein
MTWNLTRGRTRRRCLGAAVILATSVFLTGARAQSRSATLRAIHSLENPSDRTEPGPGGELGPYQFCATTWRQCSLQPFSSALDPEASEVVAIRYYEWLKGQIERHGMPASTYNIALAWNGGLRAVLGGHPTRSARDYAQRAANLAADYDRIGAVQAVAPSAAPSTLR